jgi:transcriptional regulator of acetoin/glycerol metabolism
VSEPVQIHGVEHFCSEVGVWTCAATPIWHPNDGELLGVVDISGPARNELFDRGPCFSRRSCDDSSGGEISRTDAICSA